MAKQQDVRPIIKLRSTAGTGYTYVTRKNMMTGKEYQERFDTPYFCSPSRESYWSM